MDMTLIPWLVIFYVLPLVALAVGAYWLVRLAVRHEMRRELPNE